MQYKYASKSDAHGFRQWSCEKWVIEMDHFGGITDRDEIANGRSRFQTDQFQM
jgi:hypothetical protein